MPKGSPELTAARKEEIINSCEQLYRTMSFKEITLKDIGNVTSFKKAYGESMKNVCRLLSKFCPEIAGAVSEMDSYDVVIIGFPIWWGVAPRIVETFLESYDFSGKTILPFCTSGGSGVGRSDVALHRNVAGDVKWGKGIQINRPNKAEIKKWLEKTL